MEFRKAVGCDKVGVLDIGAGSGLLSMMAARYTPLVNLFIDPCADGTLSHCSPQCYSTLVAQECKHMALNFLVSSLQAHVIIADKMMFFLFSHKDDNHRLAHV